MNILIQFNIETQKKYFCKEMNIAYLFWNQNVKIINY